jgi:hemoglobin
MSHALFDAFYERVRRDDLLGPLFANMDPDHQAHVAAFVGEVFGGPKAYSSDRGGHAAMVRRHMGRHLTQDHRRRWMSLLIETADAVGLRDDPEFRSAFVGYLEWGTRLAVLNSQDGASEPHPKTPMPSWNWGPTGGPWLG